jgi:phage regulator Rha-like protein
MEPAWEKVRGGKFSLLHKTYELPNGGHKEQPYYELTKTECLYIATKFNDEARAKLVLRWERLEMERITQPKVPALSRKQILLYALQAEEETERLRDISLDLLSEKYSLMADNAQLRRTLDYFISNH